MCRKKDDNMEPDDKRIVQGMIDEAVRKAIAFQTRKIGDTPTDDIQLVPRKYVTMNGSVAGRPIASIATVGQRYFASDTNIPMYFTAQQTWVNGVGSVVALS